MAYADRDEARAYQRAYYHAHKEERALYREVNPGKCRAWNRDWKARNKTKQAASEKRWRNGQPWHRPTKAMTKWIREGFKRGRSGPHRVLGWTIQQLRGHLEDQFVGAMCWENYGHQGWHIEHIQPLSEFRYVSQDDPLFAEAWALSNLRPLWGWENQAKGKGERRK